MMDFINRLIALFRRKPPKTVIPVTGMQFNSVKNSMYIPPSGLG